MNQKNKKCRGSFSASNYEKKNQSYNITQKRDSKALTFIGNISDFNQNNSDLKRFGTNELKKNSDNDSEISSNILRKKKKFQNRCSLKYIEKNIKNRILDISMKIEKEENSGITKDNNNLNLSTFIKKQIDGEHVFPSTPKNKKYNNNLKRNSENKTMKFDLNESNSKLNLISKNNSMTKTHIQKGNDKFRFLTQRNIVYDSFTEEEKENEDESFYISPKSKFILIFDFLIIICCIFDIVYTPYYMSKINGFCDSSNNFVNYLYYFMDILYIFDLLLGFVRSYYNFQFIVIKYKPRIVRHYIVTQFWFDFFQSLPIFTYISFLCKNKNYKQCQAFDLNNKQFSLLILRFIKQIKLFKIIDLKKNSIMFKINEDISEKEVVERIVNSFITTVVCIFCFYSFISIHIFIGRHSYPNWITRNGFQDQSLFELYLTSFYYLITTMTTVGYGDIVVVSFSELIFQIIILSVGITVYSWIVSNIGNYVKNESYASMRFNKDGNILEEIRISYPNMPFKLYNQIIHHLNARKIRQQQCDSNLLINSLPYSLKNSVLLAIYKQTINSLKIFKNCKNSDFILRLLTNFIPIFSKKNAILIHEGQLIEKIIFVKNGRLALQAALDIEEPEESFKYYLNKNFGDISDNLMPLSKYDSSNTNSSLCETKMKSLDIAKTVFESVVNTRTKSALTSEINESGIGKELGKLDYGGDDFEESNYQFISIVNIAKNESYGVVFMSLTKPSPLSLRVKSKKAELLMLRKTDAMDISQRYPNIWMKYLKKSYFNILSIKNIAIKKIKQYIDGIEKKSKLKKPILKSKTNLNPYTIYKLKNEEINDIKNIIKNNSNTKLRIQKAKTLAKKRIQNLKKDGFLNSKLNASPKKNPFLSPTNFTSHFSSFNKNNLTSNIKKDNNSMGSNRGEEKKSCFSPMNKSKIASVNRLKGRNPRYPRKEKLNQLKAEIKKLKNSKQYYKQLCQTLTQTKSISNFNLTSLKSDKNINKDFGFADNINQNVNIFHSIKPNIINNITIKNSNKFLYQPNNKSNSNDSISSSFSSSNFDNKKNKKFFDTEKIKIKSEINLFYTAKYINLDNYTFGEFSRNKELRKQLLNFINIFLEKEKNKNKNIKIEKRNTQNMPSHQIENPYRNNYDFRYILNKLNLDQKRRSFISIAPKTTFVKKIKSSISPNITTSNKEKKKNSFLTVNRINYSLKGNKNEISKQRKKFKSVHKKNYISPIKNNTNNSKRRRYTMDKPNDKSNSNSINEANDKNSNVGILKLPLSLKTFDEWENEYIFNKQIENDLSKMKSVDSDEFKNEILSYGNENSIASSNS